MQILPAALAFAALFQLQAIKQPIAPGGPAPTPQIVQPADDILLKTARIGTDGPALVGFFKKRVPATDVDMTVNDLIKQLGDKDEAVQHKPEGELVAIGPSAVAALRQASNG